MSNVIVHDGTPMPLGATPKAGGVNFAKYLLDPYAKAFTKGSVFSSYNKQRQAGLAGVD